VIYFWKQLDGTIPGQVARQNGQVNLVTVSQGSIWQWWAHPYFKLIIDKSMPIDPRFEYESMFYKTKIGRLLVILKMRNISGSMIDDWKKIYHT
jgi:hypothetical protein